MMKVGDQPDESKESAMNAGPFTEQVLQRLRERNLALPTPSPPAGAYEPFRLDRGTGYLAAQLPSRDGKYVLLGRVGEELTSEQGREAAQLAALNAMARIHQALDGFDRLRGLLRVDGFVASAEGFFDQPQVLDGASELFLFALGERGKHARTAFAPPRLPKNNSVELIVTFAFEERV
jgi:enamine deaminase RidA (YjgF/YER057c/UK114 family)